MRQCTGDLQDRNAGAEGNRTESLCCVSFGIKRIKEKKMKNEFQGIFISPSMQVKRFYEYCFWPNYVKGIRPIQEDSLNFYEILKKIVRCIGSDFQYDLETMRI